MTATLDLSLSPQRREEQSAKALKNRLAQLMDMPSDQIVFCNEPVDPDNKTHWTRTGVSYLTDPSGNGLPVEIDWGELGFFTRHYPDSVPDNVTENRPSLVQLEAALGKLTPAALAEIDQTASALSITKMEVGKRLLELTGIEHRVSRNGLVFPNTSDTRSGLAKLGLIGELSEETITLNIPDIATARALIGHLGVEEAGRKSIIRRTTKETDITVAVDLDGQGAQVSTGVHFFDHMLEQISKHGDIRLDVTCVGDVDVDAHHTIEDVCLALGDALREALGDKRGIGRYGFALPMDETRASAWIDLSGRPFFRFDGHIPGERVGDYPVEMAAHAFRSISETLKAAIHIEVEGENAHHMIEASFKAFARALRQAVKKEGDDLPSTKGAL